MTSIRKNNARLPWWLSGQESTCYHRRHGFDPWSGKIPHAVKQLSPCVKLLSPHATVTEPTHSRARTPQERPLQREAREPQLQSASHFPNLEKSLCCNKDLAQSDNNIKNNDKWKLLKIKKIMPSKIYSLKKMQLSIISTFFIDEPSSLDLEERSRAG